MDAEDVLIDLAKEQECIRSYQLCVFKPYIKSNESYPPVMVYPEHIFWVDRSEIYPGFLEDLTRKHIQEGAALGLTSEVMSAGNSKRHLPLIDFNIEKSPDGLTSVFEELKLLGHLEGYMLDSGRSYHYIGSRPLSDEEFYTFLERIEDCSIVGKNWPRLQRETGFAVLRLTACPERGKTYTPKLIEKIRDLQLKLPGI